MAIRLEAIEPGSVLSPRVQRFSVFSATNLASSPHLAQETSRSMWPGFFCFRRALSGCEALYDTKADGDLLQLMQLGGRACSPHELATG